MSKMETEPERPKGWPAKMRRMPTDKTMFEIEAGILIAASRRRPRELGERTTTTAISAAANMPMLAPTKPSWRLFTNARLVLGLSNTLSRRGPRPSSLQRMVRDQNPLRHTMSNAMSGSSAASPT